MQQKKKEQMGRQKPRLPPQPHHAQPRQLPQKKSPSAPKCESNWSAQNNSWKNKDKDLFGTLEWAQILERFQVADAFSSEPSGSFAGIKDI